MAKVEWRFKTGSANWKALFDGRITGEEFLNREYLGPISEEVVVSLKETGAKVEKILEETVTGWSKPPTFIVDARVDTRDLKNTKAEVVFLVTGPDAEKWFWIDKGTPVHDIPANGRKPLGKMPMRPYSPRTTPGTGLPRSSGSGIHGKATIFKNVVRQGIKARDFQGRIAEYLKSDSGGFKASLSAALKRAKRRILGQ